MALVLNTTNILDFLERIWSDSFIPLFTGEYKLNTIQMEVIGFKFVVGITWNIKQRVLKKKRKQIALMPLKGRIENVFYIITHALFQTERLLHQF